MFYVTPLLALKFLPPMQTIKIEVLLDALSSTELEFEFILGLFLLFVLQNSAKITTSGSQICRVFVRHAFFCMKIFGCFLQYN